MTMKKLEEEKEPAPMDGKKLRTSFNSNDGIGALKKFVQACKKNNTDYNEADTYLEAHGTIHEIVMMLKKVDKKNLDDITLIFSAMQILIVKIAAKYGYMIPSTEQACRFFIKEHIPLVHTMLSSNSNAKQRRTVLKLLSSIVYLGTSLSREILNHLSLHPEMVATLTKQVDPSDPNSVRTSYIHFILALLLQDNVYLTKALVDKRDALCSIFPEMIYDSYDLVRMVLVAIKEHILLRQGISKTMKLFVFKNRAVESLMNLYNWKGPQNCPNVKGKKVSGVVVPEEKEIVVETLHDFLLTLLTSKKHGIIFQDSVTDSSSVRGNNQIVNAVLQNLECPWEHHKPAQLIVEILAACPGLVKTQFGYVEPYLEPRVSKKWISAVNYIKKIIELINLDNILTEISGQPALQLSNTFLNVVLPQRILNSAVSKSLESGNLVCRFEGIELLKTMLNKVVQVLKLIEKSEFNFEQIRKIVQGYVAQYVPSPDALSKLWMNSNSSEEEISSTEISVPTKLQYLDSIVDLFLVYRDIIPDITFIDVNFNPTDLLNDLNEMENETELSSLKIKVVRFLLLIDPTIFDPTKKIFANILTLLVLEKSTKDLQITLLSNLFEGYSDEVEIWVEKLSEFKDDEDKIQMATWFAKVAKSAKQNSEKYIETFSTTDKSDENRTIETLDDVYEYLTNNEKLDTNLHSINHSVSPFVNCAIEKFKKSPKPKTLQFLRSVFVDIFHLQIYPETFVSVIKELDDFPLVDYFDSWIEESSTTEKILPLSSSCPEMKSLLDETETDKKPLKLPESQYEKSKLLRIALFCLTQLSGREILTETVAGNCKSMILHLIEESKSNPSFIEFICRTIFTHPKVLDSFKATHKKKEKGSKMATKILCELTKSVRSNSENILPKSEHLAVYRNKLGNQLSLILEQNLQAKKVKQFDVELVDVFGLQLEDSSELLKKIIDLDKSAFVGDNSKLSDLGLLVPKLFKICYESEETMFEDGELVKKCVRVYNNLKADKIEHLSEWEDCLLEYYKKFERHITEIDNETFGSFFKHSISSSLVKLVSFLVSKNLHLTSEFVKILNNNPSVLKQSKVVFPIMSDNMNRHWDTKLMLKLYEIYRGKITKYLIQPQKNVCWIPENKKPVIKLIVQCCEPKICSETCRTILENGDKINVLNLEYLELLEALFTKNVDDLCSTRNFLQVLIFVMVNILKKESSDGGKINFLCTMVQRTVSSLKSKGILFEELSKSNSWTQFTRFSLKLGLKVSKNKDPNRLMKVLSEVCDIAYADNGIEEYVKTMFEMTTTHSEFLNVLLKNLDMKSDLLQWIWTLIRKNNSVMMTTQIPLYLASYTATLNESDQLILMILTYYEKNKKITSEYKPFLFGEAAATHYSVRDDKSSALWRQPTTTQFFDLLVPEVVNETIQKFPTERKLQNSSLVPCLDVYDPAFYLPLFYSLLSEKNVVPYRKFIRSGALALTLISLSSLDAQIRAVAYNVLQRFYNYHLVSASSKHDVLLWVQFLQVLGNGLQSATESKLSDVRLSGFVATFMARVSLVMNEHPLYASLHAFFRAKSALNLNEVPELLHFLHSSEVEHLKHRRFILQVIRDGMKTENDAQVALKSPVFKLVYNFYHCSIADNQSKILILEIFEAITKLTSACRTLMNNFALVPWLNECAKTVDSRDQKTIELLRDISSNVSKTLKLTKTKHDFTEIFQLVTLAE